MKTGCSLRHSALTSGLSTRVLGTHSLALMAKAEICHQFGLQAARPSAVTVDDQPRGPAAKDPPGVVTTAARSGSVSETAAGGSSNGRSSFEFTATGSLRAVCSSPGSRLTIIPSPIGKDETSQVATAAACDQEVRFGSKGRRASAGYCGRSGAGGGAGPIRPPNRSRTAPLKQPVYPSSSSLPRTGVTDNCAEKRMSVSFFDKDQ
jgi:hypothetical protein